VEEIKLFYLCKEGGLPTKHFREKIENENMLKLDNLKPLINSMPQFSNPKELVKQIDACEGEKYNILFRIGVTDSVAWLTDEDLKKFVDLITDFNGTSYEAIKQVLSYNKELHAKM